MAIKIEAESEHELRLQGPQTARGRLYEWSYTRHWPELNVWPPESAMYAVLHNPGRATGTQSDGGMSDKSERLDVAIQKWNRTIETSKAIEDMPADYRRVVYSMYKVEPREKPKEAEQAAEVAKLTLASYRKAMDYALAWLQGRLNLVALRANGDCEQGT